MKGLRPRGGFLQVLFAFDPRRTAILLLGGNNRERRSASYQEGVPVADRLCDEYLAEMRHTGLIE